MKKSIIIFLLVIGTYVRSEAQKISVEEYIDTYSGIAIIEMVRTGVPADVTLAQGTLESGGGNGELTDMSNNHFGIKNPTSTENFTLYNDDTNNEKFQNYTNGFDSYIAHSDFLKKKRYEKLFTLKITDYVGWARGLKDCHYATDPNYAAKLIILIKKYNLHIYTIKGQLFAVALQSL